MGADLITVAYTMRSKELSAEEAEAALTAQLEAVRDALDRIDHNDERDVRDLDERGYDEDGVDGLLDILLAGWSAHSDNWRYSNQYPIPTAQKEDERLWFIIAGGTSWGDDPFEGFSDLCFLINAADAVPELGEALGLLGGGIVIPGRELY